MKQINKRADECCISFTISQVLFRYFTTNMATHLTDQNTKLRIFVFTYIES